MKKLLVGIILTVVCAVFAYNAEAAIDAGDLTVSQLTHTIFGLTLDTNATTYDTLYICYFQGVSSTDTVFAAFTDSTVTDTTMYAFTPSTGYVFFTLARGSDGTTDISGKDTTYTRAVPIFPTAKGADIERYPVLPDSCYPVPGSAYRSASTTFTLDGKDAVDYSLIYRTAEFIGLELIGNTDSIVVSAYIYPVLRNESVSDSTYLLNDTIVDSIASFDGGFHVKTLSIPVTEFMQIKFQSLYGNGQNRSFQANVTLNNN